MGTNDALAQELGMPTKSSQKARKVLRGQASQAGTSPYSTTKKDFEAWRSFEPAFDTVVMVDPQR